MRYLAKLVRASAAGIATGCFLTEQPRSMIATVCILVVITTTDFIRS